MNTIKFSVGRGGLNNHQDVGVVQTLLNAVRLRTGGELLAVDGIVGPKTIAAIEAFQQENCSVVDGRVDPGHETVMRLNYAVPQLRVNDGFAYLLTKGRSDGFV
jgi:peptidoglycan hydrolase-like protein with peptidoglycan-binding domain